MLFVTQKKFTQILAAGKKHIFCFKPLLWKYKSMTTGIHTVYTHDPIVSLDGKKQKCFFLLRKQSGVGISPNPDISDSCSNCLRVWIVPFKTCSFLWLLCNSYWIEVHSKWPCEMVVDLSWIKMHNIVKFVEKLACQGKNTWRCDMAQWPR